MVWILTRNNVTGGPYLIHGNSSVRMFWENHLDRWNRLVWSSICFYCRWKCDLVIDDISTDHDFGAHGAVDRNDGSCQNAWHALASMFGFTTRERSRSLASLLVADFVPRSIHPIPSPWNCTSFGPLQQFIAGDVSRQRNQRPQVDHEAEGQDVFPDFWMFHDRKGSVKVRSVQFVTVIFSRLCNDLWPADPSKGSKMLGSVRTLASWLAGGPMYEVLCFKWCQNARVLRFLLCLSICWQICIPKPS